MSAGLRSEDQFLCSICLDLFTDPISTPCGHNFCRTCINQHWNSNDRYNCPLCKEQFNTRPRLRVNPLLREMVDQIRLEAQQAAEPGEVLCDVCTGTKLKALKSCLVCLTSYCQTHLEPHLTAPRLKRHQLLDPVDNLEDRMCLKQVRVDPPSYDGAVVQLEEDLRRKKMMVAAEVKRVQTFEVDLILSPKTSNSYLILSDDGKQVHCGDVWKKLPENPERFTRYPVVLASEGFSSGIFYFQVQVQRKTKWALGVVRKSINRKNIVTWSPQNGFWTVWLINGNQYYAFADTPVRLSLDPGPEKVGVFVDYQEGLVSFYDVDAAALIYSFTDCCFNEPLYPYFNPGFNDGGKNSTPLIICPVKQPDVSSDEAL